MLAIYVLLFNVILDKGIIPESWTEGIIVECTFEINERTIQFFSKRKIHRY
jgi:hypothetical protein